MLAKSSTGGSAHIVRRWLGRIGTNCIVFDDRLQPVWEGERGTKADLGYRIANGAGRNLTEIHGTRRLWSIDDIMARNDLQRRSGFMPLLQRAAMLAGQGFHDGKEERGENWPEDLGKEVHRGES